jgi:hypothetical protein
VVVQILGLGTDHAGHDTSYSAIDFVDCGDGCRVKEFVGDFLLADDDGCRFGFYTDYRDSCRIDGFEGILF